MAALLLVIPGTKAGQTPKPTTPAATPPTSYVLTHPDGQSVNTLDLALLKGDTSSLPIGVFDSGIGGLTVLQSLLTIDTFNNATLQPGADGIPDFAGEKFIYFGDQANMPYGNYPSKGKEDYLRELIVKDAVFLLGKRYWSGSAVKFDKPPAKAIVIACNTATAYGIEDIRAALKAWGLNVPVIGVVEAGARAVVEQLPSTGKAPTVGVLATVGTCASNAYPKAIARMAGLAGKPVPQVFQQGSVGLAGAIEGNPAFVWSGAGERPVPYAGPQSDTALNSVDAYARFDSDKLVAAANNLRDSAVGSLDMVILGCTHFPLVEREIGDALDQQAASGRLEKGKRIFINPAEYTAKDLFRELARTRLRHPEARASKAAPTSTFFLSVPNPESPGIRLGGDGSLTAEYKESRPIGQPEREDTKAIRMTTETLPASSRTLVQKLPAVWVQLQSAAATASSEN